MKASAMEGASGEDSASQASDEQLITLQIYVPELVVQKCMQFNREEIIWDVKNQILAALPKELKEGFNYGLFCPPVNGRAGKFLDEERPLADYPFTESTTYVELRYKRRIYKMSMEEKQLKQLHSRANLRRLLEHVHNSHVEKITKMCSRGLDPNFHCQETGESPLTMATGLKHPAKVIMALVNGGAHLDFRTKEGCTVLHKAVEKNNLEALRTLLDLGSSPNYKDSRGLTTLYYSVLYNSDPQLTEMLLHDHALIGTADPHGWQEVHQACKYGLVQHLEHLLFYGADMNARNASGNTPMHVCAVNDQESCARVLLFRGADKNALNYANQNPHQVAVIAGNLRLAEIIKNHKPEDVVPYREAPKYNPRRRTSTANMGNLSQNQSDPRLEQLVSTGRAPSPCPSNHSLPHIATGSTESHNDSTSNEEDVAVASDAVESLYVGANSSGTDSDPFDSAKSTPLLEAVCICVEEYNPSTSGHLQLAKGDLIEVLAVSGSGYLEGRRRDGEEGLFPAACIQEVTVQQQRCSDTMPGRHRSEGRRSLSAKGCDMPRKWKMFGEPRTVILHKGKKGFGFILRGAKATSPLMERQPTEFWPSLQYLDDVDKGGVAEMAGLRKGDFLLEINGQDVSQASHEHVVAIIRQSGDLVSMTVVTVFQQQASASHAQTDKSQMINRQCATLPRKLSTKKAPLPPKRDPKTTLSVGRARARSMVAGLAEIEVLDHTLNEYDSEGRSTKSSSIESIPNKPSSGATPESSTPSTTTTTPIITTTATSSSSSSSLQQQQLHQLEARHPRPPQASTTSEMQDFFARHSAEHPHCAPLRNKYATVARIHKMKRRRRFTSFGHPIRDDTDFRIPKNYSSTPELMGGYMENEEIYNHAVLSTKRSRSLGDVHMYHGRYTGRRYAKDGHRKDKLLQRQHSIPETSRSHHGENQKLRERSATPELQGPSVIKQNGSEIYAETVPITGKSSDQNCPRSSCPPPSYPPPPPPVGQVIKVDVSRGEYANATLGRQKKGGSIMSSFRPSDDAKLYASPDAVTVVGYKKDSHSQLCNVTLPRHFAKGNNLRSHSLPPKMPQNAKANSTTAEPGVRSTASLDTDYSSGESTTGYVPSFKTSHRSREHQNSDTTVSSDKRGTLRKMKSSNNTKTSSPKQYPAHEHFIPEPDDESSEGEDIGSISENKNSLLTFRAIDNQTPSTDKTKQELEASKSINQTTGPNLDVSQKGMIQRNAEKRESHSNNGQNGKSTSSDVVLSEETGERIFVRDDKSQNMPSEINNILTEKSQAKTQKIPPAPPPKKTDDHTVTKTSGVDKENTNMKTNSQPNSDKKKTVDSTSKTNTSKESSVPFKATIILKQTEVIQKDVKEIPSKGRNKELVHQLSAQELITPSEAAFKSKVEDVAKEETKQLAQKVKSPPQTLQKPNKHVPKVENIAQKDMAFEANAKEKADAINSQKIAPAVPKKPKAEEIKMVDENECSTQQTKKSLNADTNASDSIDDVVSPSVEMSSKSVKENIYNFEKQSQLASAKTNMSPRRKSDVIRITLIGSQQKALEGNIQDKPEMIMQTMKTSKSCPKTFEEDFDIDENLQLTAMLPPDIDSQVTRFSAETPTTTSASKSFPDEWRRPGVVSPVTTMHVETISKRPPETAPKTTTIRKGDKDNLLSRRASSNNMEIENGDLESTPFSGAMTINRQTALKNNGVVTNMVHSDNIMSTATLPRTGGLFTHGAPQAPGGPTPHESLIASSTTTRAASTPTSRPPGTIPPNLTQMAIINNNISSGPHQPNVPLHAPRSCIANIPLSGLSQTPPVPPHASSYSTVPHSTEQHRRQEAEYFADSARNKEFSDQPYYVASPSQPSKAPPGVMSAQARLLDNRHFRAPPPANRMVPPAKGCEDDVCLRLCEQVDKSLQLIRLQVDSLGMAAANEPEVLAELVPPPPEFNFSHGHEHPTHSSQGGGGQPPNSAVQIAPPPEFSDESLARQRRAQHISSGIPPNVPQHRMVAPQMNMDAPVGRRAVPPDMAVYPYPEQVFRGHVQQSPQDPRHPLMHNPHQQQQQILLQQQKQQQLQQIHQQQQQKLHTQQQQFHHQMTPQQQQIHHQQQLQQQQLQQQQLQQQQLQQQQLHQQQQQHLHMQQQQQQMHHQQPQQIHHSQQKQLLHQQQLQQQMHHPQHQQPHHTQPQQQQPHHPQSQQQQPHHPQSLQQQPHHPQAQQQQTHHPQTQQQQPHHQQQQQQLHHPPTQMQQFHQPQQILQQQQLQQQQKLMQQQQMHNQPQHSVPNHLTSSPIKTMTMSRGGGGGYTSHHPQQQQQIRYETNCNTLPHPGARMVMLPPQPHHHQQPQHLQQRMDPQHPFSPGRNTRDDSQSLPANIPPPPQPQKEFRQKPLHQWNMRDVSDWLESLFLPEYKICFAEAGITGSKLANMDNNDLMGLGVKQAGHRLNMERSIKWYLK